MSGPNASPVPVSGAQLIWAVVVLVLGSITAVCFLAFALPEGKNPALYVGLVFQTLLQVLGLVAVMFKVAQLNRVTQQVQEDTNAMRNGEMESKLDDVPREAGAAS